MGEVEFFDKVKKVNRFLSNESRKDIWSYILKNGKVPIEVAFPELNNND